MSIIIIGAGQIGQFIALKLSSENKDVIIIEQDEEKLATIGEDLDVKVIHGNGASPAVLREAGVGDAQMLIAVTDSDEINLLACTMSSLITTVPIKVARVRSPGFYQKQDEEILKKMNINMIINPEKEAADAILRILTVPGAVDVLNFLGSKMKLIGVRVEEDSELLGKHLQDITPLGKDRELIISMILRGEEPIIPSGHDQILKDDLVYFIAEEKNVPHIMELFGKRSEKIKRVMIDGGSYIGMYLAKNLEENDIQVKIIDANPKACSKLVRNLDKTVVLNEEATDQAFLTQENVGNMDAFISVSSDSENNILSSLLAKRLGAAWTITLINQISYIPLVTTIGVDVVVSPRLISNSKILHFIRQGKVLSVSSLQEDIEILEIEAMETSDIVGKPIRNARMPKESLILCIERAGNIFIPTGETELLPGDKVVVQAATKAVPKIEKLFTVKLEYF